LLREEAKIIRKEIYKMSIHPSFRAGGSRKRHRSVLKRFERLKHLFDKEEWEEGDTVFGLPKIKILKVKIKKEKQAEAPVEGEGAVAAEGAAPAEGQAAEGKPAEGAAKPEDKADAKGKPEEKGKQDKK